MADPFRELDRLTQQVLGTAARPAAMPMDAWRQGDSFYICLDLPGINPDSIDLTVEQNVLIVRANRVPAQADGAQMIVAERPYGTFIRQVFLGETLDTDNIAADYAAGGLRLCAEPLEGGPEQRGKGTGRAFEGELGCVGHLGVGVDAAEGHGVDGGGRLVLPDGAA